ncbi:ClpP/crotonase-like domain-containing protein [Dichotomocladium elegans]|nr:ClpP/crotonase-like domain-containing protein [Dichotomocladium elegans]
MSQLTSSRRVGLQLQQRAATALRMTKPRAAFATPTVARSLATVSRQTTPKRVTLVNPHGMAARAKMSTLSTNAAGIQPEVRTLKNVGVREIILNRPKKFNALNLNMVKLMTPEIQAWEKSDLAKIILLKSCGGKAFCAGGDVKSNVSLFLFSWKKIREEEYVSEGYGICILLFYIAVVDLAAEGKTKEAIEFFEKEYQLDHFIGTLETPFVSIMDGITMGGGVGLSVHAPFRIATENTLFAMPETGIGFLPDVGGSFFLSRLDGQLGTYLGLTGKRLSASDVFYAGIATHYVPSSRIPALEARLSEIENPTHEVINTAIEEFSAEMDQEPVFSLGGDIRSAIDRCFKYDTVEEIVASLEKEETEWAEETLKLLKSMSPTALKVTLQQIRTGASLSLAQAFKMEYHLVQKFLEGHDFAEGVNSQLAKPRKKASWQPSALSDVNNAKLKQEYFDSPSPLRLELLNRKDFKLYPHRKYMLPSEDDVKRVVTGETADVGIYALSHDEIVQYFLRDRNGKQGVKAKVLDVLKRKTHFIEKDESKSLKWIY